MYTKTIKANSGHTMYVEKVDTAKLLEHGEELGKIFTEPNFKDFFSLESECSFYEVRNWDKDGVLFFIVVKKENEYMVFYRGGAFWSGFGRTIEQAIEGAQKAGWMYA